MLYAHTFYKTVIIMIKNIFTQRARLTLGIHDKFDNIHNCCPNLKK